MSAEATLAVMTRLAAEMFGFSDRLHRAERRIAELEAALEEASARIECYTNDQKDAEEVSGDGEE